MKVAVLSFAHERAETYVRLLRDMPGVDLVTADPDGAAGDPVRGRAMAERLGVSYVDSWDEVFASGVEGVVVTSEVDRRRELVDLAGEAEAFVLCEQPLATKEADVKAMVDACDIGGVRLTVASPACFSGAFAAVRQGIADGVVGTLTTVHGSYHSTPSGRGEVDGGALASNAPFLLDLVDAVLDGEPAEQVYAQTNNVLSGHPGVESAALVTVRYSSGMVAAIDCGWSLSPPNGPAVTFVGDRASVEYDASPRLLGGYDAATGTARWEPGGADPYAVMLKDFVSAVDNGQWTGPDGAAGLRTLRIIQAAYESAQTGQPVDIG
ncbi:Gfo/Idh/MocA family oxidoreductase [Actinophytocola sp.]|uniref:Gfo/Idh/MocA family protein n=1 Tax=Actinophytocola sp. TaxID=1872138 RepID=UPI002ED161E2